MPERKKILIIDDEENYASLLKMRLEVIGAFDVYAANDGKEGLKMAKRLKPHLILLDIRMPGMDGHQVLERLKQEKVTMAIPVVMLTSMSDDASKIKASGLYSEDYLVKPLEANALKAKIESVFERMGTR